MRGTRTLVTPFDIELLEGIERRGTLVGAAREVGMSRDRAVYRIHRLERALGRSIVRSRRGGSDPGSTELTSAGRSVLEQGTSLLVAQPRRIPTGRQGPSTLEGIYRARPDPSVEVPGLRVAVAFVARDGEPIRVAIDPDAILLALAPLSSSARNFWWGTVERVARAEPRTGTCYADLRIGVHRLRAAVTRASVQALGLRRGTRVAVHVKATAVRRLPPGITLGSPRW